MNEQNKEVEIPNFTCDLAPGERPLSLKTTLFSLGVLFIGVPVLLIGIVQLHDNQGWFLQSEASKPTPPKLITKAKYDLLEPGQQLMHEVETILGRPGEETSRNELFAIYQWVNPDGSNIVATFQIEPDQRLILYSKSQTFLP